MLKESEYRGHQLGGKSEKKLEDGPEGEEMPAREVKV